MTQRSKGFFGMLSDFLGIINSGAEELSKFMKIRSEAQKALSHPDFIFDAERYTIETAMDIAQRRIEHEKWLDERPGRREEFQQTSNRLEAQLEKIREKRRNTGEKINRINKPVEKFPPCPVHSIPEINEEIKLSYKNLVKERDEYFADVRNKFKKDTVLRAEFEKALKELEHTELLVLLL